MESKHTPGPWTCESYDGEQYFVSRANTLMGDMSCTKDQAQANASLIAAAPDMLEALHKAANTNDYLIQNLVILCNNVPDELITMLKEHERMLCTAIAKAQGKSPTPVIDVCLAGNPAVDGVCGDSDCVCSDK